MATVGHYTVGDQWPRSCCHWTCYAFAGWITFGCCLSSTLSWYSSVNRNKQRINTAEQMTSYFSLSDWASAFCSNATRSLFRANN